jgi:DNA replication and repair protein RecF
MRLEKLHLVNFKNYAEAKVDFIGNIHCFLGKNGSGKTNLLEAVHYLSFTKGRFLANDTENVLHGQDHFFVKGLFEKKEKQVEVACTFALDRKKTISENGKDYTRFSDHIGKYPLVFVAPDDVGLIADGGEARRKFFDTLLSQVDKEYLENLIIYQSQLRQRNSLLKMFAERGSIDQDLMDSYDEKIISSGTILFQKRSSFIKEYLPLLADRYNFLTEGLTEKAGLTYESELEKVDFKKELQARLDRDMALGRTTLGIHRDDFLLTLNNHELKRFGSQGQQKSFLIALKLAEFDYLTTRRREKPMLLLDDIFDKLDDDRIHQLMKLVTSGAFGQIFITDARPGRSLEVLKETGVKSQNFSVEHGTLAVIR